MAVLVNCSFCGKLADPNLKACPHCRKPMHGAVTPRQSPSDSSPKQCPGCDTPVKDGDIICVRCGTNLLTGQKIMQEQTEVGEVREPFPQSVGIVGVIVVAVALIGSLFYFVSRDPLREATRLAQGGNLLDAINTARGVLESSPDNLSAHLLLGKLYWRNQDFGNSAQSFERASQLAPANAEAGLLTVLASSKTQQATSINRQIAALRRVTDNHPNNADAWYLLALALGAVDEFAGQEAALKRVIALSPSSKSQHYLGVAQLLQQNYVGAGEQLRGASAGGAASGDLMTALGLLAISDGDVVDGAAKLAAAVNAGTGVRTLAQARLGLLYMEQGDYMSAQAQLKQAAGKVKSTDSVNFYYAVCLQALGRNAEALVKFEDVVQTTSAHAAEASLQLTIIYMNQGNLPKAREFARQATQLKANSPRLLTAQGLLFASEGNFAQAQQLYRQAIAENGNYPAAHLENGLLYIAQGGTGEGLRELSRYLQLVGDGGDGRTQEIELLVEQLRQTSDEKIAMEAVQLR